MVLHAGLFRRKHLMEKLKMYCHKAVITPLVSLVVLIIYLISMLGVASPIEDGLLSESFFPLLIFLLGAPVSVLLFLDGIKSIPKEQTEDNKTKKQASNKKPLFITLLVLFLVFTFESLGYMVVASVFVFFFMLIYDDKPQKIVRKIIYTALIVAFVYVLYGIVFDVRFPQPWR
jgi:MFS family permease